MNSMEYHTSRLLARTVSTILAVAVSGLGTSASAQTTYRSEAGGLEEVIVTARKRDESVQDVPVARHRPVSGPDPTRTI